MLVHLKHLYPLQEAMYPVDLPSVDHNDLTSASEQYMSSLESSPCDNEWFQSSQTSKVAITATNVSQLQLFEGGQPACAVLALHPSDDQTQGLELSTLLCEMFQTQTDALCSDVTFQWSAYTCTGSGGFWMTSCERQANPEVVWCR